MYLGEIFQYSAFGEMIGGTLTGYDEYHGSGAAPRPLKQLAATDPPQITMSSALTCTPSIR